MLIYLSESKLFQENDHINRPRIFYGWIIVMAGMGIHFWISFAWMYGIQVFFNPILNTFGWSRAAISGAFSLQRLEGSIITPIEGYLVDRFGPRKMVLFGVFIVGCGLISMWKLQNIYMFYVCVLTISLGVSASIGIPRNWAIVQWFKRLRGRALGIGATGAAFSGPMTFILVILVEWIGWEKSFLILGILTWLICLPLGFLYRGKPEEYGLLPDGDSQKSQNDNPLITRKQSNETLTQDGMTPIQALKTRAFWTLVLIFAFQTMGVSGMLIHQVPYFESVGFSKQESVSVLAMFTMLSLIGRVGGGWLFDFVEKRFSLALLMLSQSIAFIILANITSYWQAIPFSLFFGMSFGGMMPARGVMISTYFGTRYFGTIQGLSQSATVISGVISPLLMGYMFDIYGSYMGAVYVIVVCSVLGIPLCFSLKKT